MRLPPSLRRRLPLPGLRWQLTLWYAASVLVILLLAAGSFALAFKVILDAQVDGQLQAQARQMAANVTVVAGQVRLATSPETMQAISPWARVLDAHGHIVFTTPSLRGVLLQPASVTVPLTGGTWDDTVRLETFHLVRFYARPLRVHGAVVGVVQVGQPLDLVTATAGLSALVLALLLPFFLVACLGGSYWLAGRALAPVRRLTRLATAVQDSGDLRQRVPVPLAQDEIRALAETLNAMLARLEAAFAVQRRFVADASHDLRTPVAAILSLAENARDGIGAQTPTQSLSVIAEQAQRLRQLITNLLQLSRADEGHLESEREPLRITALLQDVVAGVQPLAEERGITLTLSVLDEGVVLGDLAQLILVLMNLLDNALAYTPHGGQVVLSSHREGAHIVIAVRDTGMGIAPADLPHIFERFYRADPARQRATGGSGLGLAIVRTLVEAHQGTVTVESVPGAGSRFLIRLPLVG
jgi:two-component system, OmpR family, sensor kinase